MPFKIGLFGGKRDFNKSKPSIQMDASDPKQLITLEELEKRYIGQVLIAVGGNKTHAAKVLGFDRRTLYRKLDKPAPGEAPDSADTLPANTRPSSSNVAGADASSAA